MLHIKFVCHYFPCVIHNLFSSFNIFSSSYLVYDFVPVKYESMQVNNHWVEHHRLCLFGDIFFSTSTQVTLLFCD